MRFRPFARHFVSCLSLLAAACSGGSQDELRVAVIGRSDGPFESGARLSLAGQLVRAATSEGLVGFDEQGRVIPALADRWIVTDDGLSYIFRLRDGTWPADGPGARAPLTAESARTALRAALSALKGTTLAQDMAGVDEVRIMAGRVIEIRLSEANPDLLQLLAQPELGLLRRSAGKVAGAGPMAMTRAGMAAQLVPIAPPRRGLPEVKGWDDRIRPIRVTGMAPAKAVERFRAGEVDMVLGGTFADFPLTAQLGFARGAVTPDPVVGLFGLIVVRDDGFLATAENREAMAMAVDREALATALGVGGWTMSNRVVAPGMEGDFGTIGERWTGVSLADRQSQAAARVARWRKGEGPRLRLAMPAGPGADVVFARLAQDLRKAGITLIRVPAEAEADLRVIDAVARYPRANWFLGQLSCAAKRGLCSAAADDLAAQARAAPDQASRAALLAHAEADLTAANVYIPLGMPLRWSLVRGIVPGFAVNRFGVHPLMSLALLPR